MCNKKSYFKIILKEKGYKVINIGNYEKINIELKEQ